MGVLAEAAAALVDATGLLGGGTGFVLVPTPASKESGSGAGTSSLSDPTGSSSSSDPETIPNPSAIVRVWV